MVVSQPLPASGGERQDDNGEPTLVESQPLPPSGGEGQDDNGSSSDDDCEGWTDEEMERWREAIASVCRKAGRQPQRVLEVYDRRAPAVRLTQAARDRLADFMTAAERWNGFSPEDVVVGGHPQK